MAKEIDEKYVDLESIHGNLVKMECMHPWSDQVYNNTKSPLNLSGWYRLTFEDGAEVEIGSIYAYALAQGSFVFITDSTSQIPDCVFVREPRALAYLAQMGASLKRDKEGECVLPSTIAEAEQILWGESGLDVPYEPLKYGCTTAAQNMDRWMKDWQQRGLIKWNEDNEYWEMTHG
jgi:hypothetical protein